MTLTVVVPLGPFGLLHPLAALAAPLNADDAAARLKARSTGCASPGGVRHLEFGGEGASGSLLGDADSEMTGASSSSGGSTRGGDADGEGNTKGGASDGAAVETLAGMGTDSSSVFVVSFLALTFNTTSRTRMHNTTTAPSQARRGRAELVFWRRGTVVAALKSRFGFEGVITSVAPSLN